MYAWMYACLHAWIHACIMHACKHVCMQSCVHAIVHACMSMHVWAWTRMPKSMLRIPCIMHAHAENSRQIGRRKPPFSCACEKHARMRRHERPKSLDVHFEKKTMLEIIPTHANETTKKLLCMRKHASMPYHAMPWRAHATCYARHVCMRYYEYNVLRCIRIVLLS